MTADPVVATTSLFRGDSKYLRPITNPISFEREKPVSCAMRSAILVVGSLLGYVNSVFVFGNARVIQIGTFVDFPQPVGPVTKTVFDWRSMSMNTFSCGRI